ncbi:MAG: hypothetical protein KF805_07080 [Phycisphaeraceae bacterium]|nr:hypothetical protein [Phycisphaeraceae bacterium]
MQRAVAVVLGVAASLSSTLAYGGALRHLDLLVGFGSTNDAGIYVVNLSTGEIKGLLSGRGMKPSWPPDPSRGSGPALSTLPGIVTTRDGRIFASATMGAQPAIVRIDPATGNRSQVAGGWPSVYGSAGALCLLDQKTLLAGAMVSAGLPSFTKLGAVYRVDLASGGATLENGGSLFDGPAFGNPMSIVALGRNLVALSDLSSYGNSGPAVFSLDRLLGSHSILSVPFNDPVFRFSVEGGVASEIPTSVSPAGFGTGPVCSDTAYRMANVSGQLYEVESSFSQGLGSGIIRIDVGSGDRELVFGTGLDSQGHVVESPPISAPSGFSTSDPSVLAESPDGRMLIGEWAPFGRVLAFDLSTRTVQIIANFNLYFGTSVIPAMRSMAIYTNCPADINLDGFADDADFTRFVLAYDLLHCADAEMPLPCPSDLNADGLVDDLDFQVFVVGYDALLCE